LTTNTGKRGRKAQPQVEPELEAQDAPETGTPETQDTDTTTQAPVDFDALTYVGTLNVFKWNDEIVFEYGKTQEVSPDIYAAITRSRYSKYFIK
jgi:hypothetical protein